MTANDLSGLLMFSGRTPMPKMNPKRISSSAVSNPIDRRKSLNPTSTLVRGRDGSRKLAPGDLHALDKLGRMMLEEKGRPSVELVSEIAQLLRDYAGMIEQVEPKLAKRFLNASRALDPWEQCARMREFARVRREREARTPKTTEEFEAFARQCDQLSREIGQRGALRGAPQDLIDPGQVTIYSDTNSHQRAFIEPNKAAVTTLRPECSMMGTLSSSSHHLVA